jgi:hypothetical protein
LDWETHVRHLGFFGDGPMALALHLAWTLMTVLRFAGIIVIFAGVALFGAFFIAGNAKAADGRIPASSWRGPGPRKAMRIIAVGALILLVAFLVSLFLPDGL